ncbi:Aldehyde dehydrogenase [Alloactinosynnema sp. L-07]|uniref:aldehyde dehydrogenase family protein n=1 Tax=Alloactinosynnema sp. L-07 TaxID=1653480 RepID=UPI00065F01D2|nr:aldehyde dehydrogenase family protein [Alloactinosynnema sp. L-07]CRK60376.1 Aldehyde dehydrogenase [Alloactinosynnema sp. L-07]
MSSTIEVHNPGTGEPVGTYPVHTEDDVRAAVERARAAAGWWDGLGFAERRKRLDAFRGVIARRMHQLAGVVHEEMGKPHSDAALEIAMILDHMAWAGRNASKVLGRHKVKSGALTLHLAGTVEYRPLGVVGVIGPWNFPVATPLGSIAFALAAGNAVVFKPSEYTPGVGAWLVDAFNQVVPEHPVFQLVTGDGSTGAALCRAGVDKIAFTGSTATAKRVMATCAETLTPMIAECGGKDALIVDEDANLDAAAEGAVWGGLANAGQACIGTERIYVHQKVYDTFLEKLVAKVNDLRAGADESAKIGPITMPSQIGVITGHISDALTRGGKVVAGGGETVGQVVQPTVLVDVPDDAPANQEETFGPTLTVRPVSDIDEAIRLTNASRYGLSATVYAGKRARDIAARIRSGMVSVNAVFANAILPTAPFGGVGDSGFGRIHGADGLREFTYPHSVVRQRFSPPLALTTFNRTDKTDTLLTKIVALVHGRN